VAHALRSNLSAAAKLARGNGFHGCRFSKLMAHRTMNQILNGLIVNILVPLLWIFVHFAWVSAFLG
jgi:hypothetical protein